MTISLPYRAASLFSRDRFSKNGGISKSVTDATDFFCYNGIDRLSVPRILRASRGRVRLATDGHMTNKYGGRRRLARVTAVEPRACARASFCSVFVCERHQLTRCLLTTVLLFASSVLFHIYFQRFLSFATAPSDCIRAVSRFTYSSYRPRFHA